MEAAERTLQMRVPLPFDHEIASDPSQEGRQRLRGAFSIALIRIRPDPEQPRREFDVQELKNLAASIRERGVRQPIRVWYVAADNMYQIVSGERRFRATQEAGLPSIPCIIEESAAGVPERKQILVDQVVENWQRSDLNPYELSDALFELRERHRYSQNEIAQMTCKPESEISRLLSLQKVQPKLQEKLRQDPSGTFTRRHLIAIAQLPEDDQPALIDRIVGEKLTAIETERAASRVRQVATGRKSSRAVGAIRRYAVGTATVQISFRKRDVADADVLDVLTKVRDMVESRQEPDGE